jgi:hypothetical protein
MVERMNAEQKAKLKILSDYLITGETAMRFDMANYCRYPDGDDAEPTYHECGAVACALGHGPSAGVVPNYYDSWETYCKNSFGISSDFTKEWDFLFDDEWEHTDNTPQGAGHRIKWFLENGVPTNDDYLLYDFFSEGWWQKTY